MYKLLYKLHPPILGVHKSKMPHHILYFVYENIYQNRHHFIMLLSYVCLKLERERVKNKMASFPNLLTSTQLHPIHFHSVELNTWQLNTSPFHTSLCASSYRMWHVVTARLVAVADAVCVFRRRRHFAARWRWTGNSKFDQKDNSF